MTDPAEEPRQAEEGPRRLVLMAVLDDLCRRGPVEYQPDKVIADAASGVVEVLFEREPTGVVMWAQALGFATPTNAHNEQLQQVMVQASGPVGGWTVEIRHVLTARLPVGRPVIFGSHAAPAGGDAR